MNHGPALLLSVLTHGRVVLLAVTASWGSRWAKLRGRKDPQGSPGCLPSAVFPLYHLSLLGLL